MCLISSSEVIVTTNEQYGDDVLHGLQMITVRNYRLEKGRELQLPHKCVAIALYEDTLDVTSGCVLYQYTLTGTFIMKLFEDTTGSNTGSRHILLL
ncbi:hypothetical protein DPMN_184392 [Dreissena polymorpha]|uniref:Uncharacterized protein n=1 Tax=Dreissena polymorpha TaxID=45954 RepID=A0A9D4I7U7_DREPO|nr:hypothetical protein DPMN_184392 [Dreissena polymorpha]